MLCQFLQKKKHKRPLIKIDYASVTPSNAITVQRDRNGALKPVYNNVYKVSTPSVTQKYPIMSTEIPTTISLTSTTTDVIMITPRTNLESTVRGKRGKYNFLAIYH